jgi:hypothetical protein
MMGEGVFMGLAGRLSDRGLDDELISLGSFCILFFGFGLLGGGWFIAALTAASSQAAER